MSSLLLGFFVAVLLLSFFVIYSLKKKIEESAKQKDSLSLELTNIKDEKLKLAHSYTSIKQDLMNLKSEKSKKEKKQVKQVAHKVSEATYLKLERDYEDAKLSFASQKERLEEQAESLIKQLKEQDKEIQEFRGSYELEKKSQQAVNKEALQLREKFDRLDSEQKQQKEKQSKLLIKSQEQRKYIQAKEQEYEKLKKKLKQYNNFYVTTLSQKTMLEERLVNWEKALRVLSAWVLVQKNVDPQLKMEDGLGELVSSALEITGVSSLIEDEFSGSPEKGNNILRFEQR